MTISRWLCGGVTVTYLKTRNKFHVDNNGLLHNRNGSAIELNDLQQTDQFKVIGIPKQYFIHGLRVCEQHFDLIRDSEDECIAFVLKGAS